jgi:hypothetical protein
MRILKGQGGLATLTGEEIDGSYLHRYRESGLWPFTFFNEPSPG